MSTETNMPPGRDNVPLNHPRRIAKIAHLPAEQLAHESDEIRRLCAEYREKPVSDRRCPKCGSDDMSRRHHDGSGHIPECHWWECNECDHKSEPE
jgi:hypothetical protein